MTKKLQTFSTVSFLFLFSLLNSQFHGFIYLPSLTNYIIIFLFPTLVHLPIPTPFRLSFHQSGLFDFSFNLLTLARQHPSNHIYIPSHSSHEVKSHVPGAVACRCVALIGCCWHHRHCHLHRHRSKTWGSLLTTGGAQLCRHQDCRSLVCCARC